MSPLSRREALRVGGSLGVASLAGCSSLPFGHRWVTLTVLNFDSVPHLLTVELLRGEDQESVYHRKFRLEAPTGTSAASERQVPKVAESQAYLVRSRLDDEQQAHYHFVPSSDCRDADDPDEIVVEVHPRDDSDRPYVTFLRNGTIRCD